MSQNTPNAPATFAENLRGAMFMVMAMAGFATNDTFVKRVGLEIGLGQTILVRGLFASVLLIIVVKLAGQWRNPLQYLTRNVVLRVIGEMLATYFFILAMLHMPFANVSAIYQALPLVLTLYFAVFMREQIGWRRILAVLIGLVGVLIVIRPGREAFNIYSIAVLVSVVFSVLRDVNTRKLPKDIPSLIVALATALGVMLMGLGLTLFEGWQPMTAPQVGEMAISSAFLIVGYWGVVVAMRVGDVGFVSPFRYTVLLFSILAGIIAFNEYPDRYMLIGATIIVSAGVYTLYRERMVHRQKITMPPTRL